MRHSTDEVLRVTFDREAIKKQHIDDTTRADDCPSDLHAVCVEQGTITVEATHGTMRWFYDYLNHLSRAWRQEGEQWDADVAEDMAKHVWDEHGTVLPDQQRPKQHL